MRTVNPWAAICFIALCCPPAFGDDYVLGPDSQPHDGVPVGKVERATITSTIYPEAIHDYWIYVPAQYDKTKPACVMVFQDGQDYVGEKGPWRATVVMDNLIARGDMPVTIGIFVSPGKLGPDRSIRSYEYDSPDDRYLRFLTDEMLPLVAKSYNLSTSGNDRAICGMSSGGICAFTAAWQRPDQFSRVVSFVGSFTDIRGGNRYPSLIRKTERKPIRVFLQDGNKDLNTFAGDWWLANQEMDSALKYAGYDHQFVTGTEGHNAKHGGAILPDAMRFAWKDWPKPVGFAADSKQPIAEIVSDDKPWELVDVDLGQYGSPAITAGPTGDVYVGVGKQVMRINTGGKSSIFADLDENVTDLAYGPDGRVYVVGGDKQSSLFAVGSDGAKETILSRIAARYIAIDHNGAIYTSDSQNGVTRLTANSGNGRIEQHAGKLDAYGHLVLAPDQKSIVGRGGAFASRALMIDELIPGSEGSLHEPIPLYEGETNDSDRGALWGGLTFDTKGRLYAGCRGAVYMFDGGGVVVGIISPPNGVTSVNQSLCFGGEQKQWLYGCFGKMLYRRKTNATGVLPFEVPLEKKKPA